MIYSLWWKYDHIGPLTESAVPRMIWMCPISWEFWQTVLGCFVHQPATYNPCLDHWLLQQFGHRSQLWLQCTLHRKVTSPWMHTTHAHKHTHTHAHTHHTLTTHTHTHTTHHTHTHTHAHTHTHTHAHSLLNSQTGNWVKIYLCCSRDYSTYENSCMWAVAYYYRYVHSRITHHMTKIVLTSCMLFSEELIFHTCSSNIYTWSVKYQKCLQIKLSWHLRKLSTTLFTVLRFVCCLMNIPTRTVNT